MPSSMQYTGAFDDKDLKLSSIGLIMVLIFELKDIGSFCNCLFIGPGACGDFSRALFCIYLILQ